MRRVVLLLALLAVPIGAGRANGRAGEAGVSRELMERIVGAAMTRGGAMAFLETLTDTIGGRVTGSPESRATSELILKALKDAGFENAHIEEYALETRWQRGAASARVVSPVSRAIMIQSYGWVPGTNGRIKAPLAELTAASDGSFPKDLASFRGKAVIVDLQGAMLSFDTNFVVRRIGMARQLTQAGAVAMLLPSDKPDRMMYTSGAGFYPRGPLPVLSIAKEDTLFVRRLLAKGEVSVELDVQNTFDTNSPKERNVIADLTGTNPEEIVLLGAHFDSWDPAQGANDNGTGVAAVLEAARILKSLGVKPRATIRFAFFSGEEQACTGSRSYVEAHEKELNTLRAALIMDGGAQAPLGFQVHGRADIENSVRKLLSPLKRLGAGDVLPGGDLDSDQETFLVAGVPALSLWVVPGDYDRNHHAITDTLDKIDERSLDLDTAVLAMASYSIADTEERLGKRLSREEVAELLKRTGMTEAVEMDFARELAKP